MPQCLKLGDERFQILPIIESQIITISIELRKERHAKATMKNEKGINEWKEPVWKIIEIGNENER